MNEHSEVDGLEDVDELLDELLDESSKEELELLEEELSAKAITAASGG